jgi:putative hydroxymethylpyrimidine transport system substrate-binding protein
VTVALNGPPGALYAPLYEARANSDFRNGALAVSIVPARHGDALGALESRRAAIAVTTEPDLLTARDAGARLVAIGALITEPLDAIVSLQSRPVAAPAALAGQTVATTGTPLAGAQLETVLGTAGVPTARVRTVTVPEAGLVAALTRPGSRVHATLGGPWPIQLVTLDRAHHNAVELGLPQAGVPLYSGLVLAVRVGEARYHGPLLRAFMQSLSRGAQAVAANPAAAAVTVVRADPRLRVGFERAVLGLTVPITSSQTETEPFGYQDPRRWQAFGVWMRSHGLLRNPGNAGLAITDEFLPGQGE